ncbi:UNVERIFIED_CONTAM: hypothetical protein GTU68_039608 [Idotea baltica]|nr:hypothetical protein [Idotea baltica]
MDKWAIISVYDKSGVEQVASALVDAGYKILSTGGTAKYLVQHQIPIHSISEYTGHPEILDGRVKSLHPKIHGGILARKDNAKDMEELAKHEISPIEVVVINLYPFSEQSERLVEDSSTESLVEFIDIGGPTMIRAAAKNCQFVLPVSDPADYLAAAELIRSGKEISREVRRAYAAKVFAMMSRYDSSIASYFSEGEKVITEEGSAIKFPESLGISLNKCMSLRYGENPHQQAVLYRDAEGKELSYNNLLDMYGTLDLFLELYQASEAEQVAVIIKHSNPCGAAQRASLLEAFECARACDPVSAFGGIVAVSGEVDAAVAASMLEGFLEVILVTSMTDEAKEIFAKKKNLRVLSCDFDGMLARREKGSVSTRTYLDEYLIQTVDVTLNEPSADNLVAGPKVDEKTLSDMAFAWRVCKHVKSNAIVLVSNKAAIGVGAGQMNRVDSARLAIQRAESNGHVDKISQAVAASDAFLPFPDTLEILAEAGVRSLVQPGGSIKDAEVIKVAEKLNVSMITTGMRHFRH